MFDLIDRLERLGPNGALPVLAGGLGFAGAALWLLFQMVLGDPGPQGWSVLGYLLGLLVTGWLAMVGLSLIHI